MQKSGVQSGFLRQLTGARQASSKVRVSLKSTRLQLCKEANNDGNTLFFAK
jgi:hypothetical protein